MATSNVVIGEGQVTFKRTQGHIHDGLTSTLIDTSKYSIFDFTVAENGKDTKRKQSQENNVRMLKTFIIDTIEGRVLKPEGIAIQANAITAREIVAGTITANELSSNIVLVNNIIRSSNFINNTTTQTGWAIYSNGTGIFNSVNIRGNIYLSNTGGSSYNSSNTALYADINGRFSLKDKLTWDGNTLTIRGTLQFPNGSTPGTFNNGEALTAGTIGGITINNANISGNYSAGVSGFLIRSNGDAEFNDVTVRGTIEASDGLIGDIDIGSTYIQSTNYAANPTTAGFRINSNGAAVFNEVTVRGTISASTISGNSTVTTGTWGASSATGLKIDSDGYITGSGGGVKIRNYGTNGTDGATGTELFGNVIFTPRMEPTNFSCYDGTNSTTINNNGTVVIVSSSPSAGNLDLSREYGAGENFIRFVNRTSGNPITAIEFISTTRADFNHNSDMRLKEDIVNMRNSLDIVNRIRPVHYRMKSGLPDEYEDGFLAQELYEVYPIAVSRGLDDVDENNNLVKPWGVYYGTFAPLLTSAIQELSAKVDLLEARIQTLEGV